MMYSIHPIIFIFTLNVKINPPLFFYKMGKIINLKTKANERRLYYIFTFSLMIFPTLKLNIYMYMQNTVQLHT